MQLARSEGISLKAAWARVKGRVSRGGGGGGGRRSNGGGGGGRSAGISSVLSARTVGSALERLARAAPDLNVLVGEGQRVRVERKPVLDAAITAAELELHNYTGINKFDGRWKFQPLRSESYDIPQAGRSPIKVGPVYTYGIKLGVKYGAKILRKIPVIRSLLRMKNPLRG